MPGGGKGGASSTVTVHNGPVTVDSDSTVEVVGLDNITVTAKLEPTPLKTETKLDTSSDITSDSKSAMSVDLKPVALDICMNTSSKLPQGQIHQPFSYHLGLTWLGQELFGVNFGGESRMVMQDLPKKPTIDWPAQHSAAASADAPAPRGASGGDRGLRVRIK